MVSFSTKRFRSRKSSRAKAPTSTTTSSQDEKVEEKKPKQKAEFGRLPRGSARGSWGEAGVDKFQVRSVGYEKHGKKGPSAAPLYRPIGVDVLKTARRQENLVGRGYVENLGEQDEHPLPRYLVVNTQLPDSTGPLGRPGPEADGPGHSVVIVCERNDERDEDEATRLFEKFVERGPLEPGEAPEFRGRFKVIAGVEDSKQLPYLIRSYNYKPALITKSGRLHRTKNAVEMDCSIFRFGYSSRSALTSLSNKFGSFVLNIAFLLEGRHDDELPERVLAAVRLNHCGFHLATPFKPKDQPPPPPHSLSIRQQEVEDTPAKRDERVKTKRKGRTRRAVEDEVDPYQDFSWALCGFGGGSSISATTTTNHSWWASLFS